MPQTGWMSPEVDPWVWVKKPLFGKIYTENCMKMNEIGSTSGPRIWKNLKWKYQRVIVFGEDNAQNTSSRQKVIQINGTNKMYFPIHELRDLSQSSFPVSKFR